MIYVTDANTSGPETDVREPCGEAEGVSATEEDDEGAAEGSGRGVRRIRPDSVDGDGRDVAGEI